MDAVLDFLKHKWDSLVIIFLLVEILGHAHGIRAHLLRR